MISVELDDAAVRVAMARLQRRLADLTPAMSEIGETIKANIKLGFSAGTDPWGTPWEPLKHRQGQPLRDTGQLMNSIGWHLRGKNAVEVGTADHAGKARMHQFGGVSKGRYFGGVIPARPYLPIRGSAVDLPADWRGEILSIIAAHLQGDGDA